MLITPSERASNALLQLLDHMRPSHSCQWLWDVSYFDGKGMLMLVQCMISD